MIITMLAGWCRWQSQIPCRFPKSLHINVTVMVSPRSSGVFSSQYTWHKHTISFKYNQGWYIQVVASAAGWYGKLFTESAPSMPTDSYSSSGIDCRPDGKYHIYPVTRHKARHTMINIAGQYSIFQLTGSTPTKLSSQLNKALGKEPNISLNDTPATITEVSDGMKNTDL